MSSEIVNNEATVLTLKRGEVTIEIDDMSLLDNGMTDTYVVYCENRQVAEFMTTTPWGRSVVLSRNLHGKHSMRGKTMSDGLTREAEIEARAGAATPGPWSLQFDGEYMIERGYETYGDGVERGVIEEDADFIAHAREDIPWLLAELRTARAALAVPAGKAEAPDVKFIAYNIVNQLADMYSERIPSDQWVAVRQATNDIADEFVRRLIAPVAPIAVQGEGE